MEAGARIGGSFRNGGNSMEEVRMVRFWVSFKAEPLGFPEGLDVGCGKKGSQGSWLEHQEEQAALD